MAELTPNYGLKKPGQNDFYDVEDFNGNMDVIDGEMKILKDSMGSGEEIESLNRIEGKIDGVKSKTDLNLDAKISTRAAASTALSTGVWTSTKAGYLDAAVSGKASQSSLDVVGGNVNSVKTSVGVTGDTIGSTTAGSIFGKLNAILQHWTAARAGKIDNLDGTVSSRAPASTALSNTIWTNAKAGYLDTTVSGRASQSSLDVVGGNVNSVKSSVGVTGDTGGSTTAGSVCGKLNAILQQFLSNWTVARAGKLDNLDGTVSSRAGASTALLNTIWTNAKAGYLDAAVSSRASQTSIDTLSVKGSIKSVQNGVCGITSVTITKIDPKKSFAIVNGGAQPSNNSTFWGAYVYSLSATSLSIGCKNSTLPYISWQVIEFY